MSNNYGADKISVLKGLEAVRKRPAMYIGDVGKRGYHHLVSEVVDNSIDEALAGFCSSIIVTIKNDGFISIEDNGRGIPVEIHKTEGKPALEVVMTVLHAGGKFDKNTYKVSGGLHGVGVSVVNALSESLVAEVHRDGFHYKQEYKIGQPTTEVEKIGKSDKTGTIVSFKPDETVFSHKGFEEEVIKGRLKELAYLNKNLSIKLINEPEETETEYCFPGGLSDFVKYLDGNEDLIHDEVIVVNKEDIEVPVDLALRYSTNYNSNIFSFVNNINTIEGGTHLSGFRSALTRALNNYANKNDLIKTKKNEKFSLSGDDFREGLTVVISVKVQEPQFEGQTKTKLGNGEVKGLVDNVVYDGIQAFLEQNPKVGKRIIEKAAEAARARIAAKKARELVRKKSGLGSTTLPGKLADCSNKDPMQCELFLVEGDSAGGTAKQGRDRRTQAILPLRGKVINSEKAREDKLLANNEIQSMITALGCGFGEDEDDPNSFNPEKLRYHKIVIMTDADVDGSHIRTLLLTFFWRKMKSLVQGGYLYMAMPPLYKLKQGKKERYAYTDEERDNILRRLESENKTKIDIQRYKGLGEMNAEQLWETTMNAETRTLIQVTVDHIMEEETNVRFRELMGSEVEHRRKFITERAKFATNIDI
ncbi:DNA topoisomerase (ATP-hydrolyzing) subunit B [Candidatus Marinimicrobia bacterium]|jgi:DNA gyrase subunit B|nr:DNA topoisomerase (ATP-hydrolyzing) subunit B [Candidatus Neomarinimicrobiota bacterium]MDA9735637.1 DNA topoisomerase (ATP-hydrolyzing) subunit B [Candidatus Neomarinimicrobiota bacterium]